MSLEWIISDAPVSYPDALAQMEHRVEEILAGRAGELIWLLEHPPLYTAGTSARPDDLRDAAGFPVYESRRGGQYTYHGPGQRVAYVMLDLNKRGRDVRQYVSNLENWIIATLAEFNIRGEIRDDRVGVWVERPEKPRLPDGSPRDDKIAAIGVRLRKWVTFHGLSINLDPDLDHFTGIVPCGITEHGVTSFEDLGQLASLQDLDQALQATFPRVFNSNSAP